MKLKKALIKQIENELTYQRLENENGDEQYRLATAYHTALVEELNSWAQQYPNFIDDLLNQHIAQEEKVFGQENYEYILTPEEKGRIYSLIRCKHLLRMANEQLIV